MPENGQTSNKQSLHRIFEAVCGPANGVSRHVGLTVGTILVYALVFTYLIPYIGLTTLSLAALPVAIVGGLLGMRAGLLTAVLILPLHFTLLRRAGMPAWSIMTADATLVGAGIVLVLGAFTGWLRDLLVRMQTQSEQLAQRQQDLEGAFQRGRRIEQALRESEARFRRLAENAPDIIYRHQCDPEPAFEYINPVVTVLTGYTPEEFYADPELVFKIIHPESRHELELLRQVPERGAGSTVLHCLHKDGSTVWIDHRWVPIYDDAGTVAAIEGIARDITELKRAEWAEERYAERLRVLHSLDQAILAADSPAEIAQVAVQHIRPLIPYRQTSVVLFRFDANEATVLAADAEDEVLRPDAPILLDEYDEAIQHLERGSTIITGEDVPDATSPEMPDVVRANGLNASIHVPLIAQDRLVGTLNVYAARAEDFDSEHIDIAQEIADSLAIAIQQSRLFAAEQRRRRAAAELLKIAQVASSSLDLIEVLKQIAQYSASACETNRCTIYLLDERSEYLQPVMSQFADGHPEPELWTLFKETVPDHVDAVPLFRTAVRERRPTVLKDPSRTDLIPAKWTEPFDIQKLLVVPLISHDRVIGLMALDHTDPRRRFTQEQIDLARTIGGQVAASIENAQLYSKMQELAITDSLTGIYNRRGVFELGRREMEHVRRFGRALSAIMFDLDDFKAVNDTYGHAVGDQILTEVATRCRNELRSVDLLGRYGGDEFIVLLPETDEEAAQHVAERLRRAVAHLAFSLAGAHSCQTQQESLHITISLGIAVLEDEQNNDLDALINRADEALYHAKRAGGNQVALWIPERIEAYD